MTMKRTEICMENYPRREHFKYFTGMAYPYAGLTVNVDITDWLTAIRENGFPFFLSFLFAAGNAANGVNELRQRIYGGRIVEYDTCPSSYTVALDNGTYCYCALDTDMPFCDFLPYAKEEHTRARERASMDEGGDPLSLLYVSSVPWLSYTAIVQPTPAPSDSNPRLTWGKYFIDGERTLIPVSVLCHHALVDGVHISRFYENLSLELERMCGLGQGEADD